MNVERLLAHYRRIADAPVAIGRLRRFVLDLAIRGKLVPQNADDEPASELLKRIVKEKARQVKRYQYEAEIDNEEELGELPLTWRAVPLIALGSWAIGSGFPKNEQGLEAGPYFFLKVSDMNLPGNEKYVTTSNNFIDDDAAKRIRAKIHPPKTIIFPKIGGAIATNKRRILTKGSAIDNNCLGITCASELDVEWAFLLLMTLDFTRYQAGTAVPALQQAVLERIPVGLPPLAEQHRIVAKVNELMGLCDRWDAARADREVARDRLAAASLARLNAPNPETFRADARFALDVLPALTERADQIKALRQTILNLAVRGKLVRQEKNDEPASELMKKMIAERKAVIASRKIRGAEPPPRPSVEIEGFALPPSWQLCSLGQITIITDPNPSHRYPDYSGGTVPILSTREFDDDGKWSPITAKLVTHAFWEFQKKVCDFAAGDIVFARKGRLGLPRFLPSLVKYTFSHTLFVIKPMAGLDPAYLLWLLRRDEVVAWLTTEMNQNTGVPTLGKSKIERLPVPLPPPDEQHRIVAKIDSLMALCDRLEASLKKVAISRSHLLDAVLVGALMPTLSKALAAD